MPRVWFETIYYLSAVEILPLSAPEQKYSSRARVRACQFLRRFLVLRTTKNRDVAIAAAAMARAKTVV